MWHMNTKLHSNSSVYFYMQREGKNMGWFPYVYSSMCMHMELF